MKRIAFFDFDGTITSKDTLLEIIKFQKGTLWFYIGLLIISPYIIAYKFKLISNQSAKEKVLKYFFGGTDEKKFQLACDSFAAEKLPALIRTKALHEIKKHLALGSEIVIVTASASNWFRQWSNEYNIKIISSVLEIDNNKITGRLIGKNCYGNEKVSLIKQHYNLHEYNEIYCYGDTSGDTPMLELGSIAFYKPFRT